MFMLPFMVNKDVYICLRTARRKQIRQQSPGLCRRRRRPLADLTAWRSGADELVKVERLNELSWAGWWRPTLAQISRPHTDTQRLMSNGDICRHWSSNPANIRAPTRRQLTAASVPSPAWLCHPLTNCIDVLLPRRCTHVCHEEEPTSFCRMPILDTSLESIIRIITVII